MNLDTRGLKKRADLVHHLALHVGDEDFAKIVMENEQKNARGSNKADVDESDEEGEAMDDDLAELILGELGDEAAEFRDIKKRLQDRHAIKKKRKWAEWRKASDEVFWFWCSQVYLCLAYCTALVNCFPFLTHYVKFWD